MPTTSRSRSFSSSPEAIWKVISDPFSMSRWWPEVTRVEGVEDDRFTLVFISQRGRTVRADMIVTESERPSHRIWEQELENTPFERMLGEAITEVLLEPDGAGTQLTIHQHQKLKGYNRTGGFMVKRATGDKLDQALDGLEQIFS